MNIKTKYSISDIVLILRAEQLHYGLITEICFTSKRGDKKKINTRINYSIDLTGFETVERSEDHVFINIEDIPIRLYNEVKEKSKTKK